MNQKPPTYRIDEQVFLTMAAICILAILILAFRFAGHKPCPEFAVESVAKEYYEGEVAHFETQLVNASSYEWRFGDDSIETGQLVATNHIYKTPGFYTVTLKINGRCEDYLTVYIKPKAAPIAPPKVRLSCGDTAWVGEPFQFYDFSSGATSREWRFGETPGVDSREEQPVYTYYNKGPKTVQLTINGNAQLSISRKIIVLERRITTTRSGGRPGGGGRPPVLPHIADTPTTSPLPNPTPPNETPPAPAPVMIKRLETNTIEAIIHQIIDGKKTAAALLPSVCDASETIVTYEEKQMAFSDFMAAMVSLTRKQERKVKKVTITRINYGPTNCIKSMSVTVERRRIWPF